MSDIFEFKKKVVFLTYYKRFVSMQGGGVGGGRLGWADKRKRRERGGGKVGGEGERGGKVGQEGMREGLSRISPYRSTIQFYHTRSPYNKIVHFSCLSCNSLTG